METGNQIKILVAEDDPAMREIVTHKLSSHGFNIISVEDGKKAIETFEAEKPDIVLLDLMMPEVDGFGVLRRIRDNPDKKLAQTPVIVLSNLWSNKDILSAQALKVQAYMVKAYFTTEEIYNKIKEILAQTSGNGEKQAAQPVVEPKLPETPVQ